MLEKYFKCELLDADTMKVDEEQEMNQAVKAPKVSESSNDIAPKKGLSPILQKLSERRPIPMHYMGTSYGVT